MVSSDPTMGVESGVPSLCPGPREVSTMSGVTQRVPRGRGPSSVPSAPCEPSQGWQTVSAVLSAWFLLSGPAQSPPSQTLGESHPQERPGGITQPQGLSPPEAQGSQDTLLAMWAGSVGTALTSRQVPPLGCGQAPPLAADRSRAHVGMGATGSLVWLTHSPARGRRPSG